MSEGSEMPAPEEQSEGVAKQQHAQQLLDALYPNTFQDRTEADIEILSKLLYDYRTYGVLETPEDMKKLYHLNGLEIRDSWDESLVLSEGMIPALLESEYELELPLDVGNTAAINNVAGMQGGDIVFRTLEHRLLQIVGTDPRSRVVVRAGGDEFLIFKKKQVTDTLEVSSLTNRLNMNVLLSDTPPQLIERGATTTYRVAPLTIKEDVTMRNTLTDRKGPSPHHELPPQLKHLPQEIQPLIRAQIYDAFFPDDPVLRAPYYQQFFEGDYPYGVRFSMSGLKEINDMQGKEAGNEYIRSIFQAVRNAVHGLDVRMIRLGGTTFQIQIHTDESSGKNPLNVVANTANQITAALPQEWTIHTPEGDVPMPLFYGAAHNIAFEQGTYRKLDEVPPDMNYAECLTRWKYLLEAQENQQRYQQVLQANRSYMQGKRGVMRRKLMDAAFQNMHAQFPLLHERWLQIYADLTGQTYSQVPPGLEYSKYIDPGYIV